MGDQRTDPVVLLVEGDEMEGSCRDAKRPQRDPGKPQNCPKNPLVAV